MVCTFFGHRDTPKTIKPTLKKVLVDLIENNNVNMFYVGNNGKFDFLVKETLKKPPLSKGRGTACGGGILL